VPNAFNPQDFNRYSYVRNNPIRYIDPSGHVCSDPEDPTPTCSSGNPPPPNYPAPFSPAPVIVRNPDPLDDGLQQDDPTSTTPNPTYDNGNNNGPDPSAGEPGPEAPVVITNPDPLDDGLQIGIVGGNNYSTNPNPVISIVGAVLLLQLAIVDTALAIGIIALAGAGPLGWVIDAFALIPLEFASLNLTIFAAQMAYSGSTDHDVLPILHLFAPDVLPYTPESGE